MTTIHGFCNRLLAAHPVAAGIDPRFRVLDAPEAERAAREAFDEALEEFLAERRRASGRRRSPPTTSTGCGGWSSAPTRSCAAAASAEPRAARAAPRRTCRGALRRAAEAAAARGARGAEAGQRQPRAGRAGAGAARRPGRARRRSTSCAALRTGSKAKPLAAYREAIEAAISARRRGGRGRRAPTATWASCWSSSRRASRRPRNGAPGSTSRTCRSSPRGCSSGPRSASAYRARFSHLLVDEFQDTNRLQLRLIEALRGPATAADGRRRRAAVDLRLPPRRPRRLPRAARARSSARADAEADRAERQLPLPAGGDRRRQRARRARCSATTSARCGSAPRRGAPQPPGEGPAVELLLTAREGWDEEGIELEPATDARTPLNSLAEARFLADAPARAGRRRASTAGEMVVLLRAFTHLDAYEDSLERAGLRPYVVGGRGYWSQQQVADVCALLATIANPLDDQALFGALASPACGVAPDTLWLLRAAAGERRHVWPAVERAAGLGEAELDRRRSGWRRSPSDELELLRALRRDARGPARARAARSPSPA